jgi:YggT family protein
MPIFKQINLYITYAIQIVILAIVVLMVIRLIFNYMDVNPFSKAAILVRKLTDPLTDPVRRFLLGFGINTKIAPLITILIAILIGWFVLQLTTGILFTIASVIDSARVRNFSALVGYLLSGFLSIYTLLIMIRVIFSWGVSYYNPIMRFLVNVTEPLLGPLRRVIPPLGPFDLSPIIAIFIIMLFQAAIAGTLLADSKPPII